LAIGYLLLATAIYTGKSLAFQRKFGRPKVSNAANLGNDFHQICQKAFFAQETLQNSGRPAIAAAGQ
jgi:hypothetical protein